MANDVTLPGTGVAVETEEQADSSHRQVVKVAELDDVQMRRLLSHIAEALGFAVDASGRLRVSLDTVGGNQSLNSVSTVTTCSTVTTVGTVTNQAQLGGSLTNTLVSDSMEHAWGTGIRSHIT